LPGLAAGSHDELQALLEPIEARVLSQSSSSAKPEGRWSEARDGTCGPWEYGYREPVTANGGPTTVVSMNAVIRGYLDAFDDVIRAIDEESVLRVVDRLRRARDSSSTVFIAGNGGSAATASHFANDLGKAVKHASRQPFRVMGLADNASWLTALGNDEGYERVFAGQLENFASPGDVLIVISASGNSPNLVQAVDLARERGVESIGFLGFDGGTLLHRVDEAIWVKSASGAYGLVETAHSLLCDLVTTCLISDRDEPTQAND
jgi:D-sedoheptulose 7-phosphate isomerase